MVLWRALPGDLVAQLLGVFELRDGRDALQLLDGLVELEILAQAVVGAVFIFIDFAACLPSRFYFVTDEARSIVVEPLKVVLEGDPLRLLRHGRPLALPFLSLSIRDVLNLLTHSAAHADMCPCKVRGLGRAADLHLLVRILVKPLLR